MLAIRLNRFGRKKVPFYRIVVADKKAAVSGKYIDKIGHYNPLVNPPDIFVDKEKAKKWLDAGAKPSDTVWNLLVQAGILKEKLITKRHKKKKAKKETETKTEITHQTEEKQQEEKQQQENSEKPASSQ